MSRVVNHRTLRRGLLQSVLVVLLLGALARAAQTGGTAGSTATPSTPPPTGEAGKDAPPHLWIGLDGGWAQAFLDSPYQSGAYIGPAIPVRLDVGIRLGEHAWVAPFASAAWVKGESNGLGEPASDGFRLLVGGELQLHSAQARELFDIFGGVGLAFERLVAHSRFESCGHCLPDEYGLIANGVNLGIRIGLLVHATKFLQIGPYVGLQFSWMPGLEAQVFSYPISGFSPGGSSQQDVKDAFPWFEAGVRVVLVP